MQEVIGSTPIFSTFPLSVLKTVIRKKIFDILAQAKQVERNRTHPLEFQSPAV